MRPQGTEDRREGGRQLRRRCDQRLVRTGRIVSNPMKRKNWRLACLLVGLGLNNCVTIFGSCKLVMTILEKSFNKPSDKLLWHMFNSALKQTKGTRNDSPTLLRHECSTGVLVHF